MDGWMDKKINKCECKETNKANKLYTSNQIIRPWSQLIINLSNLINTFVIRNHINDNKPLSKVNQPIGKKGNK